MIIAMIIGFILGAIIIYLILHWRLSQKIKLDNQKIEEYNNICSNLKQKITSLNNSVNELEDKKQEIREEIYKYNSSVEILESKRTELIKSIDLLTEQQKKAATQIYNSAKEKAEQSFDLAIENISNELEQNREDAQQEYIDTLNDLSEDFQQQISEKLSELRQLDTEITELKQIVASAIADRKRTEEETNQKDFYRLQLSEADIEEIRKLREVLPYLRDKEPLNKVIYKVYYEKPYQNLIGRVMTPGQHTGIYKITNILDGKVYIGQSVNISERWRQHIKRGVGADTPTQNKLYPAMIASGVENFTFEILEECVSSKLNQQEKYWIDYFQSATYGYNVTKGGS